MKYLNSSGLMDSPSSKVQPKDHLYQIHLETLLKMQILDTYPRPTLLLTVKSINLHLWNASQVILMHLKISEPITQTSMV